MRGKQQPQDAQSRLGTHGREHGRITRDILRCVVRSHVRFPAGTIFRNFYNNRNRWIVNGTHRSRIESLKEARLRRKPIGGDPREDLDACRIVRGEVVDTSKRKFPAARPWHPEGIRRQGLHRATDTIQLGLGQTDTVALMVGLQLGAFRHHRNDTHCPAGQGRIEPVQDQGPPAARDEDARLTQYRKVPGDLGLHDFKRFGKTTNADLALVEQQAEQPATCSIGQELEQRIRF
jgi:hypothetical protein